MAKTSGIYKIVNDITGATYIGSSSDIIKRWDNHKQNLRKGLHGNPKLQNSWNKHGKLSFSFSVVEVVDTPEVLHLREQYFVDKYKSTGIPLYNIRLVVESNRGISPSAETRAKLSKASTGRTHTNATRLKLRAANVGKKMSDDRKDMLRAKAMTRIIAPETRSKMYATRRVKHLHKQLDKIIKDWST